VDDDVFMQEVMQEMLAQQGITEVHCAIDGRKALRALESLTAIPRLLICDIYMPDMDGFEFLMELAGRKYPGKILLVSGVSAESLSLARDIAHGLGLQLAGTSLKPLGRDTLTAALA